MDATNLADLYGSPLLDWDRITARLDDGLTQAPGTGGPDRHTCWLATINPDGSPHVTGIGATGVGDVTDAPGSLPHPAARPVSRPRNTSLRRIRVYKRRDPHSRTGRR